MNVHFNTAQQAAATSLTAPQTTIRQAGRGDDNRDSSISTSSSGKGFVATILTPFKAVASFIASIFSKIFCCCFGDSKEVKALKEQKAALETFQKAVQVVLDHQLGGGDYDAAVAALPRDVKVAIVADLKRQCDAKFPRGQEDHQGFAETMLNRLGNITYQLGPDELPGAERRVAMDAAEAVKAAVTNVLAGIDAQLKK